jgi:hypothetical protein
MREENPILRKMGTPTKVKIRKGSNKMRRGRIST